MAVAGQGEFRQDGGHDGPERAGRAGAAGATGAMAGMVILMVLMLLMGGLVSHARQAGRPVRLPGRVGRVMAMRAGMAAKRGLRLRLHGRMA
ncbi:hypothetical protein [Cupriavidus basilensis]|uniref:Uncharacterized protein n=1 Tax=Cupriavidus basilensis TaxID=68895 RepID=A0A7M2HA78_9BURK|nr:hypothetical protein [Cupriavidus basilensis]QOT81052.1 hypothetical protein F7R26_027160 [Cupriavidus basilensis]